MSASRFFFSAKVGARLGPPPPVCLSFSGKRNFFSPPHSLNASKGMPGVVDPRQSAKCYFILKISRTLKGEVKAMSL